MTAYLTSPVADLASNHRGQILARFAEVVERLESAGMLAQLVEDCTPKVDSDPSRRDI